MAKDEELTPGVNIPQPGAAHAGALFEDQQGKGGVRLEKVVGGRDARHARANNNNIIDGGELGSSHFYFSGSRLLGCVSN